MHTPDLSHFFADKKEIQRIVEEQNRIMGFVPDPDATPEKIREVTVHTCRNFCSKTSCGCMLHS